MANWYEHNLLTCVYIADNVTMIQKQGEKIIQFYIEVDGYMVAQVPASTFYYFWTDEKYQHNIKHEYKFVGEDMKTYTLITDKEIED